MQETNTDSAPRLVIVGGSDAGISAALRAREVDPSWEVEMLLADRWPNYSICGLPYLLSGEVAHTEDLAHRTAQDIAAAGIAARLEHRVAAIDPAARTVTAQTPDGEVVVGYDALVLGTGAVPRRPPIEGLDRAGVHLLHTIDDALALGQRLEPGARATIVGAGYIGLEMAEALRHRELDVTLVERLPEVMATVDPEIGALVRSTLERHGVRVLVDTAVSAIGQDAGALSVTTGTGRWAADVVLVVTGVTPATDLGVGLGVATGAGGGLVVDERMATGIDGVWAAGDCVHTHHRLLNQPTYLPLGTTAHKQGRVAGENALGGDRRFAGVLGTQVVKVFDLAIAGTGLGARQAAERLDARTEQVVVADHKRYYPGAVDLVIRVTAERRTGRLLGAQIAGPPAGQVAKRIDVFATAIHHDMTADQLSDLDLSYTPPFASPWDAVQMAAQSWTAAASRE